MKEKGSFALALVLLGFTVVLGVITNDYKSKLSIALEDQKKARDSLNEVLLMTPKYSAHWWQIGCEETINKLTEELTAVSDSASVYVFLAKPLCEQQARLVELEMIKELLGKTEDSSIKENSGE